MKFKPSIFFHEIPFCECMDTLCRFIVDAECVTQLEVTVMVSAENW